MSEVRTRKRAAAVAAAAEQAQCTFKPDIGNADVVLAHTRPERVTESVEERAARLGVADAEALRAKRAAANAQYYAQFTFAPAIDPASRARGRAHTVDEHVRNERGKRVKLRAAALAEAEFHAKHTFQPQLVARDPSADRSASADRRGDGGRGSDGGGGAAPFGGPLRLAVRSDPEHVSERISAHMKAKEAKLEQARRLAEYEALQECTFRPAVGRAAASSAGASGEEAGDDQQPQEQQVVVVRGLGRFLELKELGRRLDDEKA
jgi:hypothetical protein